MQSVETLLIEPIDPVGDTVRTEADDRGDLGAGVT